MRALAELDRGGPWRLRVLDGVSAKRDGRDLVLGPPQRRAVLLVLVFNAGRTVFPERLLTAVWGDDPPDKATAALQVHVSALRRALEPDRAPRTESRIIRSVDHGYLVEPVDVDVDAFWFSDRLADAERARERGDVIGAAELLRSALARFHDTALPGVPGPFAARERAALAKQRLTATEDLVELELLGRPGETLPYDLTDLLTQHPHRERLHGLQMRLMYHNGRRVDALDAFASARRILVADLGIEPGVELRQLHQRMLAGDTPGPVNSPRVVAVDSRPPRQPWLLGREHELLELARELNEPVGRNPAVVVLHGMPGVGKTATAAWFARLAAERFPGGQFFLTAAADDEHRASVLREVEHAGRALLVVDDVTSITQVRSVLPANPDVAVLITSRYRGRLLPFAKRIALPVLAEPAARELFCRVVGHRRADREPAAVDRLVRAAEGVPGVVLSLAELLNRRPEWSLADYVARLDGPGDWSINLHLRPLFERTYAELDPLLAKVLRMAALPPADAMTSDAVAALAGWPVDQVELLLEELVDRNLLDSAEPRRFECHPLVRQYAAERAWQVESTQDMWAAVRRLSEQLTVDRTSSIDDVPCPVVRRITSLPDWHADTTDLAR